MWYRKKLILGFWFELQWEPLEKQHIEGGKKSTISRPGDITQWYSVCLAHTDSWVPYKLLSK